MFKQSAWQFFLKYETEIVHGATNLVAALFIFTIGFYLARLLGKFLNTVLNRRKIDPTLIGFFSLLLKYTIIGLTLITVLGRLGFQTTSFVALIGAAGVAIGLALQGALGNFAAGVLLILFRPFKVGDLVDIGVHGWVKSVQIFSTILTMRDGTITSVPNGQVVTSNIVNYSLTPNRRIDIIIGVSYDANITKVKEVLHATITRTDRILQDQPTAVRVSDLAASSVNFLVRAWTKNDDYSDCRAVLLENIKNDLDANQIGIPYTTYDVNLKGTASLPQKAS